MNYRDLQKDLKKNTLAPVYFFTGKERFLINSYIDRIRDKMVSPQTTGLNFIRFTERTDSIGEILSLAQTAPFMSEKRVVVIDEGVGLLETSNESIIKQVENYLENPTQTTILIILSEKVDKRRLIYKAIEKKTRIIDFKKLSRKDFGAFIKRTLKKDEVKISDRDLDYLINRIGYLDNDSLTLQGIHLDILKLSDYTGEGNSVTKDIIDELIPISLEENAFKIIDLVVQGKLGGVYEILENFFEQGESPIGLLGVLVYQLRNLLKVKILLSQGIPQNAIANQTGLRPFVVRKSAGIARKFSLERLLELYNEAAKLDLDIKTGKIEPDSGLEIFLLKLFKRK